MADGSFLSEADFSSYSSVASISPSSHYEMRMKGKPKVEVRVLLSRMKPISSLGDAIDSSRSNQKVLVMVPLMKDDGETTRLGVSFPVSSYRKPSSHHL